MSAFIRMCECAKKKTFFSYLTFLIVIEQLFHEINYYRFYFISRTDLNRRNPLACENYRTGKYDDTKGWPMSSKGLLSASSYIHKLTLFRMGVGRNYRTPPATIFTYSSRLVHIHTSDHTRTPVAITSLCDDNIL